jgi:hypothetical protein
MNRPSTEVSLISRIECANNVSHFIHQQIIDTDMQDRKAKEYVHCSKHAIVATAETISDRDVNVDRRADDEDVQYSDVSSGVPSDAGSQQLGYFGEHVERPRRVLTDASESFFQNFVKLTSYSEPHRSWLRIFIVNSQRTDTRQSGP